MVGRMTDAGGPRADAPVLVQIGRAGRVVIPAAIRRAARLSEGDTLELRWEATEGGGRIVLDDPAARLRSLAGMFAHLGTPGASAADELIAERRAEAAREEAEGG